MRIRDLRAYTLSPTSRGGGDYFNQEEGHWVVDSLVANPMSIYPEYRARRTSWGINVLGSLYVEVETDDGTVGFGIGTGGEPACYLIEKHFRRFVVGSDPRDIERMWDQMFRASMPYGRKGLALQAISAVDIALWDVCGKLRGEPVYKMVGGAVVPKIPVYATGPRPELYKEMGFWGAKIPLPYGPADGREGLEKNVQLVAEAREKVGPTFELMLDCYMALTVPYTIELAEALRPYRVKWIEEPLPPDDFDGHRLIKEAIAPTLLTTGEHEYSRYGFRELISRRAVDILQPDITWLGGLTEAKRVAAMASAYDIPVIPHASGVYSYHFVISQPNSRWAEYVVLSPGGDEIVPVFGDLLEGEPLPENGYITLPDRPGWGVDFRKDRVELHRPYVGA